MIHELRESYPLKDLLKILDFPKSTYMYWQKRFDRENKDKDLEERILEIRQVHPNYGYRRIHAVLIKKVLKLIKRKFKELCKN